MSKRGYVDPEINVPDAPAPLIVARDPGDQEVSEGRPLVGPSGRLLFGGYDNYSGTYQQGSVAHAGLQREDFNITNRVLKHPWNNDFFRHSWDDINDGLRQLHSLIEHLQPSIIIACGAHAAYDLVPGWATLTDRRPGEFSGGKSIKSAKEILDRRGFLWYPADGTGLPCPLIVTLHPAACLYQPMPNRLLLDIDFQRAGAVLRGELPRQSFPSYTRIRNSADLSVLDSAEITSYDIEVKWGGDQFLCSGFYDGEHALLTYADSLGACADWLRGSATKLTHNGQFDRYFLDVKCNIKPGGRHEDTICAHWALYPELAGRSDMGREDQRKSKGYELTRKGLNFLASMHLNYPWWKTYTSDPEQMGQLCINDVVATYDAWKIMEPDIDEWGVRRQYERQIAKLPALIDVQKRGFLTDEEMRRSRMRALLTRQKEKEDESREAALKFLQEHSITHDSDGEEYAWYHDARCECCFGGETKRLHCTDCAGVRGTGANGSIRKSDLVITLWKDGGDYDYLKGLKKDELMDLFPPCSACGGEGTVPTWDFNPMSGQQMIELLWTHLDVPHYTYSGSSPNAQEATLRKVLEWSEE